MTISSNLLRVLVVEDDLKVIENWKDSVLSHNSDVGKRKSSLEFVYAETVIKTKSLFDEQRFDAVIVDLFLRHVNAQPHNSDGNELVQHFVKNKAVGVVVYTGQPNKADTGSYGNALIKVINKSDGNTAVIDWLEANKDMFLSLRQARDVIETEVAKLFFRSIWSRWQHWQTPLPSGNQRNTSCVARHMVAHVHDSLLHSNQGEVHPEESYFVPPLKGYLDTGDLVLRHNKVWIVVTPRCDLAHENKSKTILLVGCKSESDLWNSLAENTSTNSKKRSKLVQHNQSVKEHFLAPMFDENGTKGPWLAQFSDLKVVPINKKHILFKSTFASLSPMYIPSLVERFGAYFSRIGTPDLSADD